MPEWMNGTVSKTVVGFGSPWVRISLSPCQTGRPFTKGRPVFFVLSPAILKTIVYIAQQNIDEQDTQDKKLEKNILLMYVDSPIKADL